MDARGDGIRARPGAPGRLPARSLGAAILQGAAGQGGNPERNQSICPEPNRRPLGLGVIDSVRDRERRAPRQPPLAVLGGAAPLTPEACARPEGSPGVRPQRASPPGRGVAQGPA